MTRVAPLNDQLDGSWLKARWYDCKVTKNGEASDDWETADVSTATNTTGYDSPGGVVDLAFDKRYNGRKTPWSKTIVEFGEITKADGSKVSNQALRAGVGDGSRYKDETVYINLGMIARPVGQAVK